MFFCYHIYYHLSNQFSAPFICPFYERSAGNLRVAPKHSKPFFFLITFFMNLAPLMLPPITPLSFPWHILKYRNTNTLWSPQVRGTQASGTVLGAEYPAVTKVSELLKHSLGETCNTSIAKFYWLYLLNISYIRTFLFSSNLLAPSSFSSTIKLPSSFSSTIKTSSYLPHILSCLLFFPLNFDPLFSLE